MVIECFEGECGFGDEEAIEALDIGEVDSEVEGVMSRGVDVLCKVSGPEEEEPGLICSLGCLLD